MRTLCGIILVAVAAVYDLVVDYGGFMVK